MNHIDNSPGVERAKIINREDHNISRKLISPNALKVLYRLGEGNFDGYLVGGCVRDIMLGKKPKDASIDSMKTLKSEVSKIKNAKSKVTKSTTRNAGNILLIRLK